MGDETLIALLHIMPKTHPLLIKRIGPTILDHAPGAPTVFPIIKLANAGPRSAYSIQLMQKMIFFFFILMGSNVVKDPFDFHCMKKKKYFETYRFGKT